MQVKFEYLTVKWANGNTRQANKLQKLFHSVFPNLFLNIKGSKQEKLSRHTFESH